ncbi:hypothetical protein MN116_006785 [Schistosoma mekongi]|uniref:G-protein coupled receptors family 1 profile domain-containing protein n=1 Tax=Schistosoma mekongi TaxID=38744 RepID=A0AAE2D3S7_SCHME|nr:hypothetical protein MN116_006785 [Schistosoma mekongi]
MILSIDSNLTEYHPKVHHSLSTFYSVAPIIILIIGIPGNLLSMVIWLRRLSITVGSTSLLIGIMCMTDTYVIAHGCLRQWIIGITDEKVDIRIKLGCGIPLFLFTFSTDLSTWIIILLCIERAVCVWTPIKFKQWCKLEHGITALILVVLSLASVNIHYVWTVHVKDNSCAPKQEYKAFHLYWPYIDFAIYSFIPLAFILLVNISIIWRMKTTNISTKHTQNAISRPTLMTNNTIQTPSNVITLHKEKSSKTRVQRSARVLRTVVCMTISHFLLTMPIVFFYLFESKFCIDNKDWINVCDTIERVTVILQMINHMTHFFIYSCTSSVFLSDLNRLCENYPIKCCQSVNTMNTRLVSTCTDVDNNAMNCSHTLPTS